MQILTGIGLGAIAMSALKVDIINNYEYGAGISPELATVMVIAAVCVAALPAVAAIFGWSSLLRTLTAVCVLLTCWAAINAYAQKMGAQILGRTAEAAKYASAEKDQARARATLAAIKETADTATLERLIADAGKTAEALEQGDTKKMGAASCFKFCREAKAAHAALLDRLAEAKTRDAAKAELAEAKTDAEAGPSEASMVATWIAARTNRDAADIARTIALVMTILGILVTQGVALLAHTAVKLIGSGVKSRRQSAEDQPEPAATETPAVMTEAAALDWLRQRIRTSQGTYIASGNKIADEIGVARSTFAKWVQRWIESGALTVVRSGRRTEFSVPKIRRVA
jgi:hypothetical protein